MKGSLALAFVLACSTSPGSASFGTTPFATATSDQGKLDVAMYSSPDPIARVSSVKLVVKGAQRGAPVDGLTVAIVPFMPAMGHGSSTTPTVTGQGQGTYVASDVVMPMAGQWELRTSMSGPVVDTLVVDVQVP